MKNTLYILIGFFCLTFFTASVNQTTLNTSGMTVETRILPPKGFVREKCDDNSFTKYLRTLPLKAHGAKVHLYNKSVKAYQDGAFAVVDMEIGETDLQQCADAIMRLRAEWLWKQKKYSEIHFNFTSGDRIDYVKWAEGSRLKVLGSRVTWEANKAPKDYSYATFRKYLDKIFMYAGTASLTKELISVPISNIQPGDVFIHGGNPGHAILVLDVVINTTTKQKAFICAQSFVPAQEIEILKNLNDNTLSPWYTVKASDFEVKFPQWTFTVHELKRFR
ncbi:MAG: DUF4846 domain-containing protein [Bacteroidales bacterium]|nr:DUF4846 domain-containing protein [Bacteroidales bacterium]